MFAPRPSPFFWRRRSTRSSIRTIVGLATATAIATAAAVYYFDPDSGRRRRTLLRDQAISAGRRGRELAGKVGRSAQQQATAIYQRSKSQVSGPHSERSVEM